MIKYESISMNAWPALQWVVDDGWVLRFSKGYTKRANSVIPIDISSSNYISKVRRVEEMYQKKHLPSTFKLTQELILLDEFLSKKDYKKIGETSFQTLSLDTMNFFERSDCIISNNYDEKWFDRFTDFSSLSKKDSVVLKAMLKNSPMDNFYFMIINGKEVIGCGLGVVEDIYFGIFDIYINASYQGQGYGKRLLKGMLNYAKHMDLKTAYLQVVDKNEVAKSLYQSLGFEETYKYWYRIRE